MKHNLTLLLVPFFLFAAAPVFAQTEDTTEAITIRTEDDMVIGTIQEPGKKKGYFTIASDMALFQSAALEKPGMNRELSYLRFTFFVNTGMHFNYDFDEHFGMYVGLGLRNLGFTDKVGDSTIKRRVYALSIPVGIKVGNLGRKSYAILGGGIDLPFNYREKGWVDRGDKTKFSEWFSDRTPSVMPFLFAGLSIKSGTIIKLQFYPSNFLNTSFEENADPMGVRRRPYTGYDARIVTLSLGYSLSRP